MKIADFDLNKDILIVAEIGNNHEGNITLAKEMIRLAAQAGVGAVKFQTIIPEKLITSSDTVRLEQLKRFQLSYNDYTKLAKYAGEHGLMFLSTPFDTDSAKFLNKIVPAFKIASSDNTFYPLIKAICKTGKPIIISCGMAEFSEISNTVSFIRECWIKYNINSDLAILHCVSNYPVKPEDANLLSIQYLKDELECTIGYSDHTIGIEAAIIAVALGARIIEKHFTIDKNYSEFHDHQLSADPDEMTLLVRSINEAQLMLGQTGKPISKEEQKMKIVARRSIAASKDIPKGSILTLDDITWLRPGSGILAGCEETVLGKKTLKEIQSGELIKIEDIE